MILNIMNDNPATCWTQRCTSVNAACFGYLRKCVFKVASRMKQTPRPQVQSLIQSGSFNDVR